jgi:glycine/D-amino acid oxidase-like deaminating enzyme
MHFLIVGAGLAGTTAAHLLRERGFTFELLDSGENVSSAVAGGIINPLVFRRMTLSWRLDEFLPVALRFFEKRAREMNQQFYHAVPIRRFFASEQEREFWLKKQALPDFQPYMQQQTAFDATFPNSNNTYGTGLVLQSGYVDAARYTEANRLCFSSNSMYLFFQNCSFSKVS